MATIRYDFNDVFHCVRRGRFTNRPYALFCVANIDRNVNVALTST